MELNIVLVDDDGSERIVDEIPASYIVELVSDSPILIDVDEGHDTIHVQFQSKDGEVKVTKELDNNLVLVKQLAVVPA